MSNIIYTIGHSTVTTEEFFDRLKQHNINALVDIRSIPFSQYAPQFNREILEQLCRGKGIRYFFFGKSLGGEPHNGSIGGISSRADYDHMRQQENYLTGIDKLTELLSSYKVCLMCSEGYPDKCHRNLLVGQSLQKDGINVLHILPDGKAINTDELVLIKNKGQLVLF